MTRVRRTGRTATVATVATVSAAALLAGATTAMAGGTPTAAVPSTTAVATTTSDTCRYPDQGVKVAVILSLPRDNDNDVSKIKVRASSKYEVGGFYRARVTIKSMRIDVYRIRSGSTVLTSYAKSSSPAIIGLNPASSGAEVTKVRTVTKFKLANGTTATATCSVTITD